MRFTPRRVPLRSPFTLMKNYDFTRKFRALYDHAVALYAKGQRGAETYFDASEHAFLAANGVQASSARLPITSAGTARSGPHFTASACASS